MADGPLTTPRRCRSGARRPLRTPAQAPHTLLNRVVKGLDGAAGDDILQPSFSSKVVTVAEQQLADKEDILARLRRVEGQIRGIQRMIVEERDCEAIVTQLMAARAALDRASMVVLTHHMQQCLADSSSRPSQRQLQRIIEFFVKFARPLPEAEPVEE